MPEADQDEMDAQLEVLLNEIRATGEFIDGQALC